MNADRTGTLAKLIASVPGDHDLLRVAYEDILSDPG